MRAYRDLLRNNPQFARLWIAQAVSLLGDWFNTIVLSALVARYTDNSGLAIMLLLLARFLPPLIFSPLAGVLLDRFDRRRLLVASDLMQAVVVLGFLLAMDASLLWLIYLLTVVQFTLATVFEPGRSALLPSVVRYEDLVAANVLGSVTWSTMLAIGGAAGGLVAAVLGIEFALIFNAVSFLASGALIYSLRVDARPASALAADTSGGVGLSDYVAGLRYARQRPPIALALLIKLGGNFGNIDSILIVFATYLFVVGEDGAGSLGLLWCAFGVGSILGPLLLNYWNDQSVRVLRRLVVVSYGIMTIGWLVIGAAPTLLIAAGGIVLKAMGGSGYWTYSSVILQKSVDDAYLGRMFSLDMAGFQLATVISILVTGAALELLGVDAVRAITFATAAVSVIPFIGGWLAVRWLEQRDRRLVTAAAD